MTSCLSGLPFQFFLTKCSLEGYPPERYSFPLGNKENSFLFMTSSSLLTKMGASGTVSPRLPAEDRHFISGQLWLLPAVQLTAHYKPDLPLRQAQSVRVKCLYVRKTVPDFEAQNPRTAARVSRQCRDHAKTRGRARGDGRVLSETQCEHSPRHPYSFYRGHGYVRWRARQSAKIPERRGARGNRFHRRGHRGQQSCRLDVGAREHSPRR